MTVRKYGLDWDDGTFEAAADLVCAKHWAEPKFRAGNLLDPAEHLLRACRALFTREEFSISPWTEMHAVDWTTSDFTILWGGGACGKSNDIGCFALLDWLVDPKETYTVLASTSKLMLERRSYESVIRYYKILKRNPLLRLGVKESRQSMSLINEDDSDVPDMDGVVSSPKASIGGVAVAQGDVDTALGKLRGAHCKYVRLILDEMSHMPRAAVDVRTNMVIGTTNFKFVGITNPDSFVTDLSAEFAEPLTGGWESVDENTGEWPTRFGKVRHHNGFKSPALADPEKYPYLLNQATIDRILREVNGNMDDPQVWNQIIGFPRKQGDTLTVLSEQDLVLYNARDAMDGDAASRSATPLMTVGGLDPAVTAGGDGCVLQFGTVAPTKIGGWVLALHEPIYVPIMASSSRPVTFQIADFVAKHLRTLGVPLERLAVDDSATQSVADVLDVVVGGRCMRVDFGSSASDHAISALNSVPARERFRNMATELWYLAAEFVRRGQIRGLCRLAGKQFTMRRFKMGNQKRQVESKLDFKRRFNEGRSPDEADAMALCCMAARDALGWLPGSNWNGQLATNQNQYQVASPSGYMVPPGSVPRKLKLASNYLAANRYAGYGSGRM